MVQTGYQNADFKGKSRRHYVDFYTELVVKFAPDGEYFAPYDIVWERKIRGNDLNIFREILNDVKNNLLTEKYIRPLESENQVQFRLELDAKSRITGKPYIGNLTLYSVLHMLNENKSKIIIAIVSALVGAFFTNLFSKC